MSTLEFSDVPNTSLNMEISLPKSIARTRGRIIVTQGLHRGAEYHCVGQQMIVLGSSEDCDLILADNGVASHHCLVAWDRQAFLVRALDADVHIGSRQLHAGEQTSVKPNASISFAGVNFLLSAIGEAGVYNKGTKKIVTWMALLISLVFFVGIGLVAWNSTANAGTKVSDIKQPKVAMPVEKKQINLASQVSEIFRLSGMTVEAQHLDAHKVEVRGNFTDMTAVKALIQSRAMLEIKGLKQVVVSNTRNQPVAASADDDAKEIAQLVLGSDPYVVTRDHARYYLGAELDSGKVISAILPDGVVLVANSGDESFLSSGQILY